MDKCNTYDNRMVGWVISAVTTKSTIVYCIVLKTYRIKMSKFFNIPSMISNALSKEEMLKWVFGSIIYLFLVLWFCYSRVKQYPNFSISASKTQFPSLIFRHLIPTKSRRLTVMFIISGLFRGEKIAYFYMVLISMKNQVEDHFSSLTCD